VCTNFSITYFSSVRAVLKRLCTPIRFDQTFLRIVFTLKFSSIKYSHKPKMFFNRA
jgi:hypothetical protein